MKILVVKGLEVLLDDDVYERIKGRRWNIGNYNHVQRGIRIKGRAICIQMAWEVIGMPLIGLTVDHIDRDPLNNQRSNLRFATKKQQSWNSKPRIRKASVSSPLKGAYFIKGSRSNPWLSKIVKDGKFIYLGVFKTAQAASDAYYEAAKRLFGDFASK